jgi:hypothetical protein
LALKKFKTFLFLKYTQWQCKLSYNHSTAKYKFMKTLHPRRIWTRDVLFCRRSRWPLCHAARACFTTLSPPEVKKMFLGADIQPLWLNVVTNLFTTPLRSLWKGTICMVSPKHSGEIRTRIFWCQCFKNLSWGVALSSSATLPKLGRSVTKTFFHILIKRALGRA